MANDKAIAKVWVFQSSSGKSTYETRQYVDGTTSCNCPGWTRHVHADGSRACKHCRSIENGNADDTCISVNDYGKKIKAKPINKVEFKAAKSGTKRQFDTWD